MQGLKALPAQAPTGSDFYKISYCELGNCSNTISKIHIAELVHEARVKFLSADHRLHSNKKSSGVSDQQARKLKNGLTDMPIPTIDR